MSSGAVDSRPGMTAERVHSAAPDRLLGCTLSLVLTSHARRTGLWKGAEPLDLVSSARLYESDVSVALILSISKSAAAPSSLIWLPLRLQQRKEGQGCSSRDGAAIRIAGRARLK